MANAPKVVDREALKEFRKRNDQRYVLEGEYSPNTRVGESDVAKNLAPYSEHSGATDATPFVFQSSGGSRDIGSLAYLKALRGNTIVFNQRIKDFATPNYWGVTTGALNNISNTESVFTLNGDAQYNSGITVYQSTIVGHKYLLLATLKTSVNGAYCNFRQDDNYTPSLNPTTEYKTYSWIHTGTGHSRMFCLVLSSGTAGDTMTVKNCMVIDLTLMFGAGNEPTTVEEFIRLFPKAYYEYNTGELLSCKVNGYKTVGYNAFDEELEGGNIASETGQNGINVNNFRSKNYIKVIPGQTYTLSYNRDTLGGGQYLYEYDANKNFIGMTNGGGNAEVSYNLSPQTNYVRFQFYKSESGWRDNTPTQEQAKVCLHLTWDGTHTGYKPYETHTYPMPNVELRSAGSAYDELKPDGTLIRKVGSYTFTGNEVWVQNATDTEGIYKYHFAKTGIKALSGGGVIPNMICVGLEIRTNNQLYSKMNGIGQNTLGTEIVVFNSEIQSTSAMQTFMTGKTIYYELDTPTESEDLGFQEITPIDDWGTQEFLYDDTIDIPVPQGNEFFYPVDYKAFIDSVGGRDDVEYDAGQLVTITQLNNFLKTITGYDATKNQSLKNVSGTIQWVDEE